jgi:hypothetical protein
VRQTKPIAGVACFTLLLFAATLGQAAEPAADQAAIRHVMMAQFDKPEARLAVDPVVVAGDAAVAGWAQGERGGRALLFRKHGKWHIAACAGDALKEATTLRDAGVGARDADALATNLAKAEAALPADLRAKFSTFDGYLRLEGSGQHPPEHKH